MRTILLITAIVVSTDAMAAQTNPPVGAPRGTLYFHLELNGVFPAQLTVEEGRYWVRVINGVYTEDLTIRMDDDRGQAVASRAVAKHQAAKSMFQIDLRPGRHKLQIPGRPKLTCDITVTPKR